MIRHIVFFSAKDRADIPKIKEGLSKLGGIPHSQFFEVQENTRVDQIANEVDVVVYAEFASDADLAAYKAHPIYAQSTANVRPMREIRMSADIVSSKG
ncbi:MAG: Dabb family protein [Methylobacterium mesophilicum]|nr:Dabb family protein [Methylobacterium mesophilicum]